MPPPPTTALPPAGPARRLRGGVRLVRRHLGPGPYLDYGCGRGDLLALLATRGSATGFVVDAVLAELARTSAPGCPVHTNPEALPVGVFRGVLAVTTTPPTPSPSPRGAACSCPAVGCWWSAPSRTAAEGFAVRWIGTERWRGAHAAVLEGA